MFKMIVLVVLLSVVIVSADGKFKSTSDTGIYMVDYGPLNVAACIRIIRGICQDGFLGGNMQCANACRDQGGSGLGVCANLSPLDLGASVCVCLSA
ncbi:hypothetical protein AAVH_29865 [Aphelenchoides avenae]|nr:hypothetical protein AAVH_29865 [Aphelenchus avenae]